MDSKLYRASLTSDHLECFDCLSHSHKGEHRTVKELSSYFGCSSFLTFVLWGNRKCCSTDKSGWLPKPWLHISRNGAKRLLMLPDLHVLTVPPLHSSIADFTYRVHYLWNGQLCDCWEHDECKRKSFHSPINLKQFYVKYRTGRARLQSMSPHRRAGALTDKRGANSVPGPWWWC